MSAPPAGPPGPLPPNVNRGPMFIGVLSTFFALSSVLFFARVYTRIRILKTFWWDDAVLILAFVVSVVEFATQVVQVELGYGRHVAYVELHDILEYAKILYVASLLWAWCVTLVKTSMALLLLRIRPGWFWGMLPFAVFQVLVGIATTVVHFTRCDPIAANWNPTIPTQRCWTPQTTAVSYNVLSALFVVSDFIFALLPVTFIYSMHRPIREKVILVFLMGFGLFASACAVVKMTMFDSVSRSKDPTYDGIPVGIWAHMELYVGIIAACVPCLKAPFEQALTHFGLLTTKGTSAYSEGSHTHPNSQLNEFKETPEDLDVELRVL